MIDSKSGNEQEARINHTSKSEAKEEESVDKDNALNFDVSVEQIEKLAKKEEKTKELSLHQRLTRMHQTLPVLL